ncbi:hypothetical protein CNR22_19675 [Sphingobacteriaceae bacterium]|nr:hypothetical protein CNR22_19675 [Sphingobacteriaceae bacterium]
MLLIKAVSTSGSLYYKFVGVVASCWLERKMGKYIMGKGGDSIVNVYTRASEKAELEKQPIHQPNVYKDEGKFIM